MFPLTLDVLEPTSADNTVHQLGSTPVNTWKSKPFTIPWKKKGIYMYGNIVSISITADETAAVARTIAAADRITAEDSLFSQQILLL